MICKNAFVRAVNGGGADAALRAKSLDELQWWDGSPICITDTGPSSTPPPLQYNFEWPEGCVPFYNVKELKKAHAKSFTEPGKAGRAYRLMYEELEQALRLPARADVT